MSRAAAALLFALGAAGCAHTGAARELKPLEVGAPIAGRLPQHPSGEWVDLAQQQGRVLLVDVWATWCEPCKEALPEYERLQRTFASRGLEVYALSIDEDLRLVEQFVAETGLSLKVLHDRDARISEDVLGVDMVPMTFVVDRRGIIRAVHQGYGPAQSTRIATLVEQLLAEEL